jgi:putative two-component system response regulator
LAPLTCHHAIRFDLRLALWITLQSLNTGENQQILPIIVLTGDASQSIRHQALASGAKDFIHKPFDLVEVLARIRNILEVRLLHKTLQRHNALLEARV